MVQKINKLLATTLLCSAWVIPSVNAKEIYTNMARMQAMDKITGKVSEIDVPVNGETRFGSFSITVRECATRPPEETPENFAFVDIIDDYNINTKVNIFRGWMISSSPALNAVEHPIYDVWLLKCVNKNIDKSRLLSQESLSERDGLPKKEDIVQAETLSREALIAEEAKAEAKAAETESKVEEETSSEAKQVSSSNEGEKLNSETEKAASLLQKEDELPIVPEIVEEKTLEKVVEPAQAIENFNSDTETKIEEVQDTNAPQPLLPNLDNNAPQPLLNLPAMEQKAAENDVEDALQKSEREGQQPVLLEETVVQENVEASKPDEPIVITNTVEKVDEIEVKSQGNTESQQVQPEEKAQTEAGEQSGAEPLVPLANEDIPEEEDQFIEEETISQ